MAEGSSSGTRQVGGALRAASLHEVFLLTAGLWFLGKFVRYAFPPLFEELQGAYAVSTGEIGLAYSAFFALYALLQFPSGALADRFGSARVITGGAAIAGIGALTLWFAPPFVVLVVAMAVIGAGTGAHKTVSIRLLSNVYPDHLGRALGVFDTIGAMGGVVAPLAVAAILGFGLWGWPGFFGVTGMVFVAMAVVFLLRTARDSRVTEDGGNTDSVLPWQAYRRTFSRPRVVAFTVVTILMAFAYNGLVSFLPLVLTVEGGVAPATASVLYSVLFAASLVQVVSGEAADRAGGLVIVTGCLALATLGMGGLLAALTFGEGDLTSLFALALVGGVVLLIGLGSHGYRPARDVYVVSLVPEDTTGGTLGVIRSLLMGSAAVSPAVVGMLGDRIGLFAAFVVVTAVALAAVVVALGLLVIGHPHQRRSR